MKLIYLEWADATSPSFSSWYTKDEALRWAKDDDYWISQIGWILEENKDFILISSQKSNTHMSGDTKMLEQFSHIQKIPKTWIRNRRSLNIPRR